MFPRLSRILVVDSRPTSREAVRLMLEGLGYLNLDEAGDGMEALAKLTRVRYALVIANWFMEPMPGIEQLLKLRRSEAWSRIPVIMMASRSQRKFLEIARDGGATHYLAKPFTTDELDAKIRSLRAGMTKPADGFVARRRAIA